jgi:hypothetical protein
MANLLNYQLGINVTLAPRSKEEFTKKGIERFLDADIWGACNIQLTSEACQE